MNQRLTDIRRAQLDQLLSGGTNMAGGGLLKAVAKTAKPAAKAAEAASALRVYHGSPHRMPPTPENPLGKFDATKIGTGQGAQTYGEGHYLAQARKVAQTYQPRSPLHEEKLLKEYNKAQAKSDYPKMEVLEDAMLHKSLDEIVEKYSNLDDGFTPEHAKAAVEYAKWYEKNQPEVGGLYHVNLPEEHIANMLDYDKPINQQSEQVKALLEKAGINTDSSATAGSMIGGQESHLSKHGIPGIKYYDENSRSLAGWEVGKSGNGTWMLKNHQMSPNQWKEFATQEEAIAAQNAMPDVDTRNFVIFPGHEEIANIVKREKKGGLVHLAGGGTPKKADSDYTLMGAPRQENEHKPYPKTERMNLGVKAVKSGLDSFNRFIDQGPSVRDVLGNVVGAVPFVGPDLRKGMEESTLTIPYGFERSPDNPKVATGVQTAKVPTTDILDALKMSDITGGTGASNLLGSVGKGYAPNPMDVLDTLGLGAAGYGVAKAGAKGAKAAGKGALTAASRMDAGPVAGSMAAQRGAVKLGGGNWVDSEVKRSIDKLNHDDFYHQSYIDSTKADLAEYEKNPNLHPESATEIARLRRDLAHMEHTNAFNKWVNTKVGSYIRNQMATPDDPVVKMLDVRAAKIEADYQAGQKRLAKLDERIAQAPANTTEEQNTLANLKRTRSQRAAEIESDRELAMNSMLPGGDDFHGYEIRINDVGDFRKKSGFPEEGYAQSLPGQAWEAAVDSSTNINPASKFQGQAEKIAASKAAAIELGQYQNVELPDKFREFINATNLSEKEKQAMIQGTSKNQMANMIGDMPKALKLMEAANKARSEVNMAAFSMAEENPYLAKLPQDTPVYNALGMQDLGIDHILDVLKDDIASGKLKLEDLNKITMDQAVKRAAEYDFEMAKKARDAVAQSRASMPVHKEYPEGYKWVQLTKPGEFNAESNAMGHSVRGYEPPRGHPDWTPESGDFGSESYGHGGWEAIKSGQAKVYSLVDPSGKSHSTIEVKKGRPWSEKSGVFYENPEIEKPWVEYSEKTNREARENGFMRPRSYISGFPDWLKENKPEVFESHKDLFKEPPPSITQIKGKGNARPTDKYDPYTQDFVKSGKWNDVKDLQNTGLTKFGDDYLTVQDAESKFRPMVADALNFLKTHPAIEQQRLATKAYYDFEGNYLSPEYKELENAAGQPISKNVPYTYRELKALLENPEDWTSRDDSIYVPISNALKQIGNAKKELGIDLPPEPNMAGGGLIGKLSKAAKMANKVMPTARIGLEAPGILIPSKMNNVREAVRNMKGNYGARRVERAADEIPNLERMFQEDALKEAFTGDNARGMMTIDPVNFEKYAQELNPRAEKLNVTGSWNAKSFEDRMMQQALDKYDLPTDEYIQYLQKLQGGFFDVPYLNLFKDEVGLPDEAKVIGHEGRHRNRALAAKGDKSTLVQIQPRGDLREGMPRRTQEDFIEALRQELDSANRLVIPESEPYFRRPSIELPDVYAEGGSVGLKNALNNLLRTDKPEAHMAGGGVMAKVAKAAKAAAKVDHPLVFPRAVPKSLEEIRPIAQRMAEQMTGEFVKQNPKLTTNPAGKSRKQFEREQNIPLETRNVVPERAAPDVNYEDYMGYGVVGVPGDPTLGGVAKRGSLEEVAQPTVELTRVGDITPDYPVPLFGGPRYGDDEKFWSSNFGAAVPIQKNASKLADEYQSPIIAKYIKMGSGSENFALHNLDALLAIQRPERLDKDKMARLTKVIQAGSLKYGKFPGFTGFEEPIDVLLQAQMDSNLRKHIAETLTKPTITNELGLANGLDVVAAITHPELRNLETGASGFSVGKMKPSAKLQRGESSHPTYDTDIPGSFLGRSKYPTPYEIAFPDTTAYARSQMTPGVQEFNMMKMLGPRERIDQQYIDEIKMYEELMKQYTGKKKGGLAQTKKVKRHGNTVPH